MKIRTDFVTNSSSSSFVAFDIESKTFASIIANFKEELEEQGWFQIVELDDKKVSIYGDEVCAEAPTDINEIIPCLARLFHEEIYIPGEYVDEYEDEEAREYFENSYDEEDEDMMLTVRIAKAIVDSREQIENDLESIEWTSGESGWGGDDDSRYEKENYSEGYLKEIYKTIAEEKGCSVEEVTDDDFNYYVGGCISNSEEVFKYNKKTGKIETYSDYSLD